MGWYEVVKDAAEAVENLKNAKLNEAMAKVMMEAAKLAAENAELQAENLALRAAAKRRVELRFEHNVWWGRVGDQDRPHCPKCWGGEERAVVMNNDLKHWRCPVCNFPVRKPGIRDEPDEWTPPREPV